jgi:hypothetical protein
MKNQRNSNLMFILLVRILACSVHTVCIKFIISIYSYKRICLGAIAHCSLHCSSGYSILKRTKQSNEARFFVIFKILK